tara:strand:+ start:134 stop:1144 length:1011 start_codon:yes stop_codon:yes gene_type:complete
MKVYIIAEVGPNHNGSLFNAKKYIDQIKKTNADAVKFQLANPNQVYSLDSFKARYQKRNDGKRSIIEMSKKNQLSKGDHLKLSVYCKKRGIDYLCSAFDLDSLKFLIEKIKIKYVKIASGEVFDKNILNYLSKKNKKFFISTGMINEKDLKIALRILNKNFKKDITLLHCISKYPTDINSVNMKYMTRLKKIFRCKIGFSDHSLSKNTSLVAVALGASVIEKHVTFNKKNKGPDHKISSEMKEFNEITKNIREIEKIIGKEKKNFDSETIEIINVARKSIVSKRIIKKNEKILKSDIVFKRPGTGLSPLDEKKVIGKFAKQDIQADRLINLYMLKK